jgi:hypothetical protein
MPLPLTQPPLGLPFTLNRTSPLAKELELHWTPLKGNVPRLRDIVQNYSSAVAGSGTALGWKPAAAVGASWTFNTAAGEYYTSPGTPVFSPAGDFSLAVWIRNTDTSTQAIFSSTVSSISDRCLDLLTGPLAGGFPRVDIFNASASATTLDIAVNVCDGNWHLLTVTYRYVTDGTSIARFYLNGFQQSSSTSAVGPLRSNSSNVWVGHPLWNTALYWRGDMGPFSFWHRELTASEVLSLYLPQTRWSLYAPLVGLGSYKAPSGISIPVIVHHRRQQGIV